MTKQIPVEHIGSVLSDNVGAVDARLDAALLDTFPASDPVAITITRFQPEGDAMPERPVGDPS